jgi:hypothetical protein
VSKSGGVEEEEEEEIIYRKKGEGNALSILSSY